MPTIPHSAAGWRIEPPVSVPSAHGARPAATAAALPPEEPPGTRSRSHGLSTGPKAEFSFDEPIANSSWLVFASSPAPAAVKCETAGGGDGGEDPPPNRGANSLAGGPRCKQALDVSGR